MTLWSAGQVVATAMALVSAGPEGPAPAGSTPFESGRAPAAELPEPVAEKEIRPQPRRGLSFAATLGLAQDPYWFPAGELALFLGGRIPRQRPVRTTLALGYRGTFIFPWVYHRHEAAVVGRAGRRGRFYYSTGAGAFVEVLSRAGPTFSVQLGYAHHNRPDPFRGLIVAGTVVMDYPLSSVPFPIPQLGVLLGYAWI